MSRYFSATSKAVFKLVIGSSYITVIEWVCRTKYDIAYKTSSESHLPQALIINKIRSVSVNQSTKGEAIFPTSKQKIAVSWLVEHPRMQGHVRVTSYGNFEHWRSCMELSFVDTTVGDLLWQKILKNRFASITIPLTHNSMGEKYWHDIFMHEYK